MNLLDPEAVAVERESFAAAIETAEALERAGDLDSAFDVYDSLFRRCLLTEDVTKSLTAVRRGGAHPNLTSQVPGGGGAGTPQLGDR